MVRVKICGLNSPAAIDAAVAAGADWIGFNFFAASPRFVTPDLAAALAARHPSGPKRVGLFVRPSEDDVTLALASVRLDILQLYDVPAAPFRQRFGLPVWRAHGVAARADLPAAMDGADVLLIEARPPADATRPGGNAVSFDWIITRGWDAPGPWVLAGGLDPGNVADAIRESGAAAVDVSSGVERTKGVKDPELIRAFIAAAKA